MMNYKTIIIACYVVRDFLTYGCYLGAHVSHLMKCLVIIIGARVKAHAITPYVHLAEVQTPTSRVSSPYVRVGKLGVAAALPLITFSP